MALASGAVAVVIAVRTALEDAMLANDLPGYSEYQVKMRWRFVPFIWQGAPFEQARPASGQSHRRIVPSGVLVFVKEWCAKIFDTTLLNCGNDAF